MSVVDELFRGECPVCITDTVGNYKESNRINELLLVPCSEIVNNTAVFWSDLFCGASPLGRRTGEGILDIAETNGTAIDTGEGCGIPSLSNVKNTCYLTFIKQFYNIHDKECSLFSELFYELKADGWKKYKVFARMYAFEDAVMPIGKFALTKHNFTHQEIVKFEIELSWKQKDFPTRINIPGLDAALQCE
jgi:hypothetical protein